MRVACPECSAEYDLPPALAGRLDGVRGVRCARCGATWAPKPEGVAADPPPEPVAVEPVPGPRLAPPLPDPPAPASGLLSGALVPVPESRRRSPAALGWAASLLLLAGLAAAAWHWRVALVEAWPPAARIFLALELAG